jgi:uncharacterized damage-inducible protein DinB
MTPDALIQLLKASKDYFDRSTHCLTEEDSTFTPVEGTRTVAQQVAHTAQTVDWFFQGAFSPEGFAMDFEALEGEVTRVTSLQAARSWLDAAYARAAEILQSKTAEELAQPLPEGIMGGEPRHAIVGAILDHTAHHRGALTVYSRLRGRVPAMPYMEVDEPAMTG